jgi:predicted branched-subunit amino acid permease
MSSPQPAKAKSNGFNPAQIAVDFVLCALFFALIFYYVRSHVMSEDSKMVLIFSTYTTVCVTGVFWMSIQMLRVVAAGEKQIKADRAGH